MLSGAQSTGGLSGLATIVLLASYRREVDFALRHISSLLIHLLALDYW